MAYSITACDEDHRGAKPQALTISSGYRYQQRLVRCENARMCTGWLRMLGEWRRLPNCAIPTQITISFASWQFSTDSYRFSYAWDDHPVHVSPCFVSPSVAFAVTGHIGGRLPTSSAQPRGVDIHLAQRKGCTKTRTVSQTSFSTHDARVYHTGSQRFEKTKQRKDDSKPRCEII